MRGERFNDMVINIAQKPLKSRFSMIIGLNSTLLQAKKKLSTFEQNKVHTNHTFTWRPLDCGSNVGDEKENQVKVFDSLYESIDDGTRKVIRIKYFWIFSNTSQH